MSRIKYCGKLDDIIVNSYPLRRVYFNRYQDPRGIFLDSPQKVSSKKHKQPLDFLQKLAKNKATRLGKSPDQQQTELFKNMLVHQRNPKYPLYLLSHTIAWTKLAEDLALHYGRGLCRVTPSARWLPYLCSNNRYSLSEERVVTMWQESPYYQYFAGGATFQ